MTYSTDSAETSALLERIAAGDSAALDRLLNLHRDYLRRVVQMQIEPELGARIDASDVIQETLIVVCNRIDDFIQRRPTSFRIWMRRKVLEQLIDQRRRHIKAKKRSVYTERSLPHGSSMTIARALFLETPSQILGRIEIRQQVQRLIENLCQKDREILSMRHVEGLSNAEVADVLHIDPSTARKRHGRALRRLQQEFAQNNIPINETRES